MDKRDRQIQKWLFVKQKAKAIAEAFTFQEQHEAALVRNGYYRAIQKLEQLTKKGDDETK